MNNYFQGISKETSIIQKFQNYYNNKNNCLTFLKLRPSKQASIDFLGRSYNESGKTIDELAVEVRSLNMSYNELEKFKFIQFPISKLNELMKFWRMGKKIFIVYLLKDKHFFINWDYYLKHNFEIKKILIKKETGFNKEQYIILVPIRNLILIDNFK